MGCRLLAHPSRYLTHTDGLDREAPLYAECPPAA